MQTPAQTQLVEVIASFLCERRNGPSRLLNVGAGKSVVIENSLLEKGCSFVCDRLDVDDCSASHPKVGTCYRCSAEHMDPIGSRTYDVAFSNYVLEHIENLDAAVSEMSRVLKPGGLCAVSIPNPKAMEFVIAKHTPLWVHRFIRGGTGWHTHYPYRSITELSRVFHDAGLDAVEIAYYPFARQYVDRFPVLRGLGVLYDKLVALIGWRRLMGNVCLAARKVGCKTERPDVAEESPGGA